MAKKTKISEETPHDPPIIEAEIVDEDPAPERTAARAGPVAGRSGLFGRLPWYLLAVLVLVIAALVLQPTLLNAALRLVPGYVDSTGTSAAVTRLASDLDAARRTQGEQETRIARLEADLRRVAAATPAPADLAPLETAAADVAARLRALEAAPAVTAGAPTDLSPLTARLDTLDAALEALRAVPIPNDPTPRLTAHDAALASLRSDVDGLKGTTTTGADEELAQTRAATTALDARLTALEAGIADLATAGTRAGPLSGLALAVASLGTNVREGRGFTAGIDTIETLLTADPQSAAGMSGPLTTLKPLAAEGVATVDRLARDFTPLIPAALQARGLAAESWWDRAVAGLSSLVTVRRVGEVTGDADDAVLARAEVRLGAGDIAGALAALDALDAITTAPLAPWRRSAEDHLAAGKAMQTLKAETRRRIAAELTGDAR